MYFFFIIYKVIILTKVEVNKLKVILIKDVDKIGKINDVLEVKDGYAKNYLIKNKLAVIWTSTSVKKLNHDLQILDEQEEAKRFEALQLKSKIELLKIKLELKINKDKVFGSISNKAIMDVVNKDSKLITKHMFVQSHKLGLGLSKIKINIYKDISASLEVEVVGK